MKVIEYRELDTKVFFVDREEDKVRQGKIVGVTAHEGLPPDPQKQVLRYNVKTRSTVFLAVEGDDVFDTKAEANERLKETDADPD